MKEKETCIAAIKNGGIETKLSMFLMGFGNIVHKQKIKGLLFMAVEIAYIVFMLVNGIHLISMLGSLGSVPQNSERSVGRGKSGIPLHAGRPVCTDSSLRRGNGSFVPSHGVGVERCSKKCI